MRLLNTSYRLLTGIYILLWLGGAYTYLFEAGPPPQMKHVGPIFLLTALSLVVVGFLKRDLYQGSKYVWHILLAGLIGYGLEVLGVHTGLPFGGYSYTDAFAPLLLRVPLIMIGAWAILSAYVNRYMTVFSQNVLARILVGSVCLVIIDLVLDPAAVGPMRLWEWHSSGRYFGIPWTNFAGWFFASILVLWALQTDVADWCASASLGAVGTSIVLFFALINAANGLWLPALIGLGVSVAAVRAECFCRKKLHEKQRSSGGR